MTDAELLQILSDADSDAGDRFAALFELHSRGVPFSTIERAAVAGTPTHCGHGRSIWSTCLACEELEEQNASLEDDV